MPDVKRPKRGSRAFWPRKRSKRIYTKIKSWVAEKDSNVLGFSGYKVGMTHVSLIDTNSQSKTKGQVIVKPATIVDCPPISVFGFTAYQTSPTALRSSSLRTSTRVFSEKLDKALSRKMKVPKESKTAEGLKKVDDSVDKLAEIRLLVHTNPGFKKKTEIFEIPLGGDIKSQVEKAKELLGNKVSISDVFEVGDFIDVSAVTRGKGFEGPVKRFGIKLQGRYNEQAHRHVGALGTKEPGKIRSTVPQAGQHGFHSRLEFNKRILKIGASEDVNQDGGFLRYGKISGDAVLIEGSVPGPAKRLIRFRGGLRQPKTKFSVDIKNISTSSKQGV